LNPPAPPAETPAQPAETATNEPPPTKTPAIG